MQKNWVIQKSDANFQTLLQKELGISPLSAQILFNRGIDSVEKADKFLNSHINNLSDPFKLPDIEKSIVRLKHAVKHKENIFVFGDYDVDGVSSSALLSSILLKEGARLNCYLPHRIKHGYGLNKEIIQEAKTKNASLLIAVDCGTSNKEEIKALKQSGVDTIVIDHHECSNTNGEMSLTSGFINPKRKDSKYQYRDLAGVGIVFRFLQAYTAKELLNELDLVSLGTVADVVPLNGENRILVKQGLKQIRETSKPGLIALIDCCGLSSKKISCSNIGFILGPRLNASGRVDCAEKSLHLLMADDIEKAKILCQELNKHNSLRQKIQEEIFREASRMAENINFKDNLVIVLSKEGWHQGVLGIVASKITERFHRPTIAISFTGDAGKGSARSIKHFHLYDALTKCAHTLDGFGGHSFAAGLTIKRKNISEFTKTINEAAKKILTPQHLIPSLEIDAEISLSELNEKLLSELEDLEPFGMGNPSPLFCSKNLIVKNKPSVLKADTLKFWVTDGKLTYCVIAYRMKEYLPLLVKGAVVSIVYTPRLETWQGQEQITLELEDIKFVS